MRKVLLTVLCPALLALAACQPPDPNAFETHLKLIESAESRAQGFTDLERLSKSVAAGESDERRREFAEKVLPVFDALWEEAAPHRVQMLEMARDMGQPEASAIWRRAIVLDGSAEGQKAALLALQGIRGAKSVATVDAVIEQFEATIDNPSKDKGDNAGFMRLEYAKTLGALGDAKAVPVLVKALGKTKDEQPVAVHKEATTALEMIGDPSAVDALLTVQFRVPDAPGTQSIGERAKRAIVAAGTGADPAVLKMLRGEHAEVNKLAASHGVDLTIVKQTAAGVLAAMGSTAAVDDLVAFMPKADCAEKPPEEPDPEAVGLRAFVANALGFIGSEGAADALCGCKDATHNPGDLWEITQAMGRIGGDKAYSCLSDIVSNSEYDPEFLTNSDFRYEIRWEGTRFLILSATPAQAAEVRKVIEGQTDPKVKENIGKWDAGLKLLEDCKDDAACYKKTLGDTTADWFPREVAAVQLARQAKDDKELALEISKAFKVRSPDARVTMAWLAPRVLGEGGCPECIEAIEHVMDAEKGNAAAEMQLAWLTARQSIAKMRK